MKKANSVYVIIKVPAYKQAILFLFGIVSSALLGVRMRIPVNRKMGPNVMHAGSIGADISSNVFIIFLGGPS